MSLETRYLALKNNPKAAWSAMILLGLLLLLLPLLAGAIGQSWVRIIDYALLYIMLALGLNIVVGYAGLLDLGYIAFYAVGAYLYALLASPHFGLHLPFWLLLPLGALVAALFGVLLGAPTLRLRAFSALLRMTSQVAMMRQSSVRLFSGW